MRMGSQMRFMMKPQIMMPEEKRADPSPRMSEEQPTLKRSKIMPELTMMKYSCAGWNTSVSGEAPRRRRR